ncbi:hypothetical protein BKA62DRAFT_825612 [Auriculariales sp. MPI-PUGE-AT-0066]|nr:hypothetical protein BKA62DRAFT_825612 [Auriculariales sp. MPI-PUGE-AT-0066]
MSTPRPRVRVPQKQASLSIDSSVAAAHDALSPYTGPPFSPNSGRTPKGDGEDLSRVDSDELLVRFSIAEVKNIQAKLRRDADAKQEELRLMVGERYRDLLQASKSIMTIARASEHVSGLLQDMKDACVADEPVSQPIHAPKSTQDDAHLTTLQSLSAHIKLLLDAPEYLWRLLEQRKYLHAAWLFLLSRVVHRALANPDEEGEETAWQLKGIDVLQQFPLVQRQWDSISHFKSNISHKATHSLREHQTTANDTCSTLITLHLLESLPLNETLSHLLTQRSKTLNALLTRSAERPSDNIGYAASNGFIDSQQSPVQKRDPVTEVSDVLASVLDVLSSTVGVARAIFQKPTSGQPLISLIERRLRQIQSADSESPRNQVADDSVVTTPFILASLPSSTHLLTLPTSIQSYRPFIDVEAASSRVAVLNLDKKLDDWLSKGVEGLQKRMHGWFSVLASVTEIWAVRSRVIEHAGSGMFGVNDRKQLAELLDSACKERAQEVWGKQFASLEQALEVALRQALTSIRAGGGNYASDTKPVTHLFSSQPPPSLSLVGANPILALNSVQEYKASLRQRLGGRTPLLNDLLLGIEKLAAAEREDLAVLTVKEQAEPLAHELRDMYGPAVDAACQKALNILTTALEAEQTRTANAIDGTIFIGRICYELATASPFAEDFNLSTSAETRFREELLAVHSRTVATWQTATVQAAIALYHLPVDLHQPAGSSDFALPSQPSPSLVAALLSIITSAQRLGTSRVQLAQRRHVHASLATFSAKLSDRITVSDAWSPRQAQVLWDVELLHLLCETCTADDSDTAPADPLIDLRKRLVASIPKTARGRWATHLETTRHQQLARLQILLAPLLEITQWDSLSQAGGTRMPLLRLGAPATAPEARVDVAQTHAPRFILLAS